jgi:hypothetical protein
MIMAAEAAGQLRLDGEGCGADLDLMRWWLHLNA